MPTDYKTDIINNYCTCYAWKFQKRPNHCRVCKHLLQKGAVVPISCDTSYSYWLKTHPKPNVMLYTDNRTLVKDNWLFSEKLDGVRGYFDGKKMYSRSGREIDIPDRIRNSLSTSPYPVDGEFWKEQKNRQAAVNAIQSHKSSVLWSNVNFFVFDIHISQPFWKRYKLIQQFPNYCVQSAFDVNNLDYILDKVILNHGEGLIVRNPEGFYKKTGRSKDVVKIKKKYEGIAVSTGNNDFIDFSNNVKFRIHTKIPVPIDQKIAFIYQGRTSHNKPLFPRLKHNQ